MKKLLGSLFFAAVFSLLSLSFSAGAVNLEKPVINEFSSKSDSITLFWEEMENADGYRIYKREVGGKFKGIKSTSDTEYTAKKLNANTKYEFRIRAYKVNEDGSKDFGPYCEPYSCTTKLATVQNLKFQSSTTTSITVSWDKVEGAEYYGVFYGICGKDGYKLAGKTESNSLKIENLSSSNRYKFKVIAKSQTNTSSYSDLIRLYTTPKRGVKPQVAAKDSASITLKWEKMGKANTYYIYASSYPDKKYKKVAETKELTYTYKKKTPKKAYYFKIAPVISNDYQTVKGQASKYKKATVGSITISVPETVRKGEYPEIIVPNYSKKIKWTSSDKSVIKLKNGRLYAVGQGKTTLTAVYNKKHKATAQVTVSSPTLKYMSAVYDVTKGNYIFENRLNERCYPASITKLITALVCLKYMDEDDVIVVGNELNMVEALSSRCNIQRGEKFKLRDILYGLLLPSGGDAAYTLAVNCGRKVAKNPDMGYVAAKNYFVSLMNSYMKSIGATGTHCVNPHGYPVDGHYSTVHDLVLVAKQVLKNKTLKKITSTPYKYVTALTGQGHSWGTTNSLIASYAYYYSPYAHGMKTGTVNDNYTGIISAATKEGKTIITVVIGCESYNARYDATHKLYRNYLY